MDHIGRIREAYGGNISLREPYTGRNSGNIPEELFAVLKISNGIRETMHVPGTGSEEVISWILYSFEMMEEWTAFYAAEYGLDGVVFADDGAGNPYVLKPDGTVTCYDVIDGDEAPAACSLSDFYQ